MRMPGNGNDRQKVRDANRRFYQSVAGVYEKVDSRRGNDRDHRWLQEILHGLRQECSSAEPTFLDIGAGTAFLTNLALTEFPHVIAADLSPAVLARISDTRIKKICAACEELPLESSSVDIIGAFATLHHLYDPREAFREAFRVLKPEGILYTDHDIERAFVRLFRWPLKAYRYFFDHGHEYLAHCPELSAEDYALTEFHGENGLDGPALVQSLREIGFKQVRVTYHWSGLLPITPFWRGRGISPLMRIVAKK